MARRYLARIAHRHLEIHPHRLPLRLQCRGEKRQLRTVREGTQGQGEALFPLAQHTVLSRLPACRRVGRPGRLDVIGKRRQPELVPLPQSGGKELGCRHLGIPQQGGCHTTTIDGETQGTAHHRIAQTGIGAIELELDGPWQGDRGDGDP